MITTILKRNLHLRCRIRPDRGGNIACCRRLGYHDLREQQLHSAKKFLQGNDVFVSLPTGSGKSLIYAVRTYAAAKPRHHCCRCFTFTLATVTTRKKIHCILEMKDPVIIAMSPDKANMSY